MAQNDSSYASITYLVTGLPRFKSVTKFQEYFGLKRNCGGAGEIADCEAVNDNSILLTYEKTAGSYNCSYNNPRTKIMQVLCIVACVLSYSYTQLKHNEFPNRKRMHPKLSFLLTCRYLCHNRSIFVAIKFSD